MKMKRSEFFNYVMSLDKELEFELTYKKINGERRVANAKLRDGAADVHTKGTGINRETKMNKYKLFQYFDVNKNSYRSAKLENIEKAIIGESVIELIDD